MSCWQRADSSTELQCLDHGIIEQAVREALFPTHLSQPTSRHISSCSDVVLQVCTMAVRASRGRGHNRTALVVLAIWASAAVSYAAAAAPRRATRMLRKADVTTITAGQHSPPTTSRGRRRPSPRPAIRHSHQRAPPDPSAPELTIVEQHHGSWFQHHHHDAAPRHASSAPRPQRSSHSSRRGPIGSHSIPRRPSGHSPSSGRTAGSGKRPAAPQPTPAGDGKLRKIRIQPCSVSHGSASERRQIQARSRLPLERS